MRRVLSVGCLVACVVTLTLAPSRADVCADFEDLGLGTNLYWNGSDRSGGFASQAVRFKNVFTDWGGGFTSWGGFSYSRVNDTNTPGPGNQYAVISGTGVGGTGHYAVVYDDGAWGNSDVVTLPVPCGVKGFYVNNTTYAVRDMETGTPGVSKKFGGASGNDPDWFKLVVIGRDINGDITGTREVYLADYRFADNAQDYILRDWTWLSLDALGPAVKTLEFAMASSDTSYGYVNTPTYFAMDGLEIDPANPATADGADWNGDGTPNLMAYVLGQAMGTALPGAPMATVMTPEDGKVYFEVEFQRRQGLTDASLGARFASTLTGDTWRGGPAHVLESVVATANGLDTVRARLLDSATNAVGFVRLEATRP